MAPSANLTHPLLPSRASVLYIANPPVNLTWGQVQATFTGSGCGHVENLGISGVGCIVGQRKWGVRFINVYHAEMALATMQGALVADHTPPWKMVLSHSPSLDHPTPSAPFFPQYLQTTPAFFTPDLTPQLLFRWFRTAGPLVSVRMNVDVGSMKGTAVVEYWHESHANAARLKENALHTKTRTRPKFVLRTFDPCSLHCSVRRTHLE
ncbi:hypothetical protein BC629DRAFT_347750 [Irpex lacteus]|nr:hypothetical protein BC629DRAFT_347750 [Irpex lacteus]